MRSIAAAVLVVFLPTVLVSCANTETHPLESTETSSSTSLVSSTTTLRDSASTVISEDEQAIYAVFVGDSNGDTVVVREDTLGDTLPQSEEEARQYIGANLEDVSSETLENYLHVNADSFGLPLDMELGARYVLISAPEFRDITGGPGWRDNWKARFPGSDVACTAFSGIGFNESHTQALVYVTRLWVDGGYYLLKLDEEQGTWEITDSFINVTIN